MLPYNYSESHSGNWYYNQAYYSQNPPTDTPPTVDPEKATPLNVKYKVIQLPNNILVHRYPTCVAIYGLGKKLTSADCGKKYIRLTPLENNASPDWTHVPAPTFESSWDKSLLLLGVNGDKLTFMKEGIYNQWLEFDSANDGNWTPDYEHRNYIKKHLYDIING